LRVMSTLGSWFASPPVHAHPPVHPHQLLKAARRKVRRRLAGATDAHEVHQARKAAKRLRYAADLLEPHDKTARRTAKRAKGVQTRLGEHQDLVVAAAFLRRQSAGPVRSAFTYGLLVARVEQQAATIRRRL
ncbi:MAG: CHAD domain-containing protein, partial [Actinomycetota bacterium]|nr:CHAD domain-containing protein [Actinomycetota bacterium]